jgi:anti-anti-sigma regulatory factor
MRFVMAERGSAFSTRDRGIRLLTELEHVQAETGGDHELTLDFADVRHISDSFADEFVATVVAQRRSLGLSDPEIEGASPFVQKVISRALQSRELRLRALAV